MDTKEPPLVIAVANFKEAIKETLAAAEYAREKGD
jgi:hypothetical protein